MSERLIKLLTHYSTRTLRSVNATLGITMLRPTAVLLASFVSFNSWADTDASHCNDGEKAIFNCSVKGSKKVASICEKDHIEYRFGMIGSPEFIYPPPENNKKDHEKFRYSADRSADYSVYEYSLQFYHENYSYVAYSGEKRKPDGSTQYSSSISVWKMKEPCTENCPPRLPFSMPEGKVIKTYTCSNGDGGTGLVRLHNRYRPFPPTDLPIPCMSCP